MTKTDFTQRNVGIDLLRALTMFVMIFVNDFWKIHDVPHWLEHAAPGEDFIGLSDFVLPIFLFVVGMSIPFAIERRYAKGLSGESTVGHIFARTFALLIMGAFITNSEARLSPEAPYSIGVYWILMVTGFICIWNQYPKTDDRTKKRIFTALKVIGALILVYLAITFRSTQGNVFGARWGILGSIGWGYLVCAMIYVFTRDKLRWLVPIWLGFVLVCLLGTRMNELHGGVAILNFPRPNFYNDFLSGVLHIGSGSGVSFVMGGVILSIISSRMATRPGRDKLLYTLAAVAVFTLAGFIAHKFWIVAKIGATPTWVFYVIATAIALYALLTFLAQRGWAGWMSIIKPAGTATLTCYLVPYLAYALADLTGIVLPDWFTHGFMGIVNCLCFALVVIGVTWILGKLRIKLKI